MENRKQLGGSSSSSFTETLFGPKDGGSSTSAILGSVFGPKNSTQDCKTQRNKGEMGGESAEASYLSSSIYYGGQEVYPPTTHNTYSQRTFKKSQGDQDPNGTSASRGNWWQGTTTSQWLSSKTTFCINSNIQDYGLPVTDLDI
ncbi:hypothetical protein LXL04_035070 [Taraxacum kok-saghyz]